MVKIKNTVFLLLLFLTGCSSPEGTLVLKKDTFLVREHDDLTSLDKKDNQIAVLSSGERLEVEHIRFNKDSMVYKVKTANGKEGWVFFDEGMLFIKNDK